MTEKPRLGVAGVLLCLLIMLGAGAVRGRYLTTSLDPESPSVVPLEVQDAPRSLRPGRRSTSRNPRSI